MITYLRHSSTCSYAVGRFDCFFMTLILRNHQNSKVTRNARNSEKRWQKIMGCEFLFDIYQIMTAEFYLFMNFYRLFFFFFSFYSFFYSSSPFSFFFFVLLCQRRPTIFDLKEVLMAISMTGRCLQFVS